MKKLKEFLEKIINWQSDKTPASDKLGHFFWGFWLAIVGVLVYAIFGWIYWILIPSIVAGAYKEYRDSKGYGTPEFLDFVFTILPAIIITLIIIF